MTSKIGHLQDRLKILKKQNQQLRHDTKEIKKHLELVTRSLKTVFWIVSADKKTLHYVSPDYKKIWGKSIQSLYQNPSSWFDAVHPEDRATVTRALSNPKSIPKSGLEYRILLPNQSIRWIRSRTHPYKSNHNQSPVLTGIAEDITNQKNDRDQLAISENRYRSLIEASANVVFQVNPNDTSGSDTQWWTKLTGQSAKQAAGLGWLKVLHPEDRAPARDAWVWAIQNKCKFDLDYRFKKPHETEYRHASVRVVPILNPLNKVVEWIGSLKDITARRKEEMKIASQEIEHRAILNAIPDIILRLNSTGTVLDCKIPTIPKSPLFSGIKKGDVLSKVLPLDIFEQFKHHTRLAIQSNVILLHEFQASNLKSFDDYEARFVSINASEVLAMIRNTTELRALERKILELNESQYRKMGQELHDGLGQNLTGIAFLCKSLARKLRTTSPPLAQEAEVISQHVNGAIGEARSIARGLHPVELETHGLFSALKELSAHAHSVFHIPCQLKYKVAGASFPPVLSTHLYRITQEAIHNAVKHAKATQIVVQLSYRNGKGFLRIHDNGVGFNGDILQTTGMGLATMQHRARAVGANLELKNAPSGGALIELKFSIRKLKKPGKNHASRIHNNLSKNEQGSHY